MLSCASLLVSDGRLACWFARRSWPEAWVSSHAGASNCDIAKEDSAKPDCAESSVTDPAGTSFLIEDVACPVNRLADMTVDLGNMFQKHGYEDASCFGHALEGNLHLVFSQVCRLTG